jgi:hypothetical protein
MKMSFEGYFHVAMGDLCLRTFRYGKIGFQLNLLLTLYVFVEKYLKFSDKTRK